MMTKRILLTVVASATLGNTAIAQTAMFRRFDAGKLRLTYTSRRPETPRTCKTCIPMFR